MRSLGWWACALSLCATSAAAFPSMVKHGYQSCAACHVDPSGSGQLSLYGRAQADTLLRWKVVQPQPGEEQEVPPSANFLWGLELPEAVNLSGNFRGGALIPFGSAARPLVMSSDLYATFKIDRFVAHVTTGVGFRNTGPAAIVPLCTASPCGAQWISREFWAGATFVDESVMVRAGRMNVPFGLRNNEHTSWVRALTMTDVNLGQQYGLSASYNADPLRGEVMVLLGNYSLGPDAYRERGYAAFAEYALRANLFAGFSSLIVVSQADLINKQPQVRHAHGVTARFAPTDRLAFTGEADVLIWQTPAALDRLGFVSWLQADIEFVPGLHLMPSFEAMNEGVGARGPSLGGWAAVSWWPLPHFEVRLDGIYRRTAQSGGSTPTNNFTLLAQAHVFL